MERNKFLSLAGAGALGISFAPVISLARQNQRPEPYKQELTLDFVAAGHTDLTKVKEMLGEYPNLLNCTWDWGGGDFETAIGGAGHMGNIEIAEYLIGQGARTNIFVLTMLGKTELVRPILEEYPSLINAKGPHGLTMLHHAEKGGEKAKELYDYLVSKGLTAKKVDLYKK